MSQGIFEADLGNGVVLVDVSEIMPQNRGKKYKRRDPDLIEVAFHHHSGAMSSAGGVKGAAGPARYRVARGWPGHPYHFWIPHVPVLWEDGSLVVYRTQRDDVRSYHTGGKANTVGLGIAWQGNLREVEPSEAQRQCARQLCKHLLRQHPGIEFATHAESGAWGGSGKPHCPGPHVQRWVDDFRDERDEVEATCEYVDVIHDDPLDISIEWPGTEKSGEEE